MDILREAIVSIYARELAVFAVATSLVATAIWFLDWLGTKLFQRSSLIGVGYGGIRTIQSLVLWGFGAGIAAYIGGLAELFDVNSLNSKIIVGVGWPTILPRLIAMSTQEEEEQPEQPVESEEEEQE